MTRRERALKNNKAKAQKTRRSVLNLATGMFADEYKRNGKWNISKLAREARVTRDSVRKYLKEANLYELTKPLD